MDSNKDQRRTHTPSPGHENHGVHVCHKCGWSFPNPHPSAKQRRAHKKICGTIQGYKLAISEEQTHFNGSDDERVSGLVVSGSNNEKGNAGNVEKLIRSEDDVFSDAVADFQDNGQNQGVKDCLQEDSLDLGTDVERVHTQEQRLSGSSEYSDFNTADASHVTVKSSSDCHINSPKFSQSESVEVGNIIGLQGQLSVSTVDSFRSSVADLKTEESSIVHGDDFSGLSSDSSPSKAEATPDVSPEKGKYAGENVTDCSLIGVEEESNLKGKDEVKSEKDMVEFMDSSDNILGETCEGVSKIAVSDAVSLDHEVGDGAITLKEKKGPESLSLLPQDELSLELNSSIITNESHVESAHVIPFTSSDVKVLQEKEEGNVNIDTFPMHDNRLDVASQSESLKHAEDVTGENNFYLNTSQLSEKNDVFSSGMHVMDSMKMETEDIHDEDCTGVSPVKLTFETYQRSHDIGESMKTEVNENNFSEEPGLDDVHKNSQFEGSFIVTSNENQRDASFEFVASETTNIDNTSHRVENGNEIDDIAVDGKDVGANTENDIEIILKDFQPGDRLQSEVEQSSDLFLNNNDDAGEMGKTEQCEITDSQCKQMLTEMDSSLMPKSTSSHFESVVFSDVVVGESARKSTGTTECTKMKNKNEEHNTTIDTSCYSHEAQNASSVNAAEDLSSQHTSHSSTNTKPFSDSSVKDNTVGEPDVELSGITAAPVQGQNGNNSVKLGSSGVDASFDSGSRCDSLEGNWGSVSVLSMQSDAPAVTDAEILPSLTSKQVGQSNLNTPQTASESDRLAGKSEMFEPPSFTTLVESSHVNSPKGWFPTVNQVMNESQGRKSDEEIIAKVTNWSNSKEHTPLKSLLGEAINSNKPKSPKMEKNSVNQKSGNMVSESNGSSGLTTVNSILGPESPSAQVMKLKEDAANEWNSPARYPAEIKREKRKLKSRPFWIQLVCCSTMDPQRR